ncbi:hypothetical protein SP5M_0076 [Escherichia phage vB_EcoP_SP5M]|uniref:Tail length tape-measure protein n=1 Tax=Escherichia phage vB_EcoP_SP5M TaxID=2750853 RepID=A0A7D5K379_9CAUD|nr:hypothetical protein PP763_gp72 [Escherichia phage vB_EcoP_SP5M]QHJ78131.1 MAG: hypothetical protein [Caudoviricetes sp.]QLF80719.1 hypothetical protein SP5M_0076 [Escherichia phage vB_EcoP_SP5M]UUB18131.1 tail length tape-measure protein T [Escherichia phage ST4]WLW40928.1 hypothetical protein DPIBCGCG_00013 [Escherichia phage KKP 3715]
MGNEPDNVTLARLEERLRNIFENQTRESREREKMEESIKKLSESMGDLSTRLKRVEESITKSEPTIEEFITIKHKVAGAGIFGKWVWAGAGAIIGVLAAARREIFAWFAG